MSRKIALSAEQEAAVQPTLNVVVQANAGTGKTFVLVQRLLRILFRECGATGEIPTGILCLTYTNAGAAEMRNRILAAVMEWAQADNEELRDLLDGIALNNPPTDEDLTIARKIFYDFIDNPVALKIQTIHSFCEDILRRFPIEANVPPAWRLVSGTEHDRLLKDAFAELINHPQSDIVSEAFDNVLDSTSEYSLDGLLKSIIGQYGRILSLKQNNKSIDYFIEKTKKFLNLTNRPPNPDFDGDIETILIKTGDVRKNLSPELKLVATAVREYDQYGKNLKIFRNSIDFLTLCDAFADKYVELKNRRGLLDFDDMLHKTMLLFSDQKTMGQILSQLDFNLRHILVDESQDTSPLMWDIIFRMLDDFFTAGEKQNPRTLFVVGDIKQSIFSFQGANPDEFASIPKKIANTAAGGLRQSQTVPLSESRRATRAVLDVVDFFFNRANLPNFPKDIKHKCWRNDDFGLVEINPLFRKKDDKESTATRKKYIKNIANKIESLIKDENISEDEIMVLIQRRNPFSEMLIRELKIKGIQTAGSDQIILSNFPAIRDLLNLIRFVLNPNDTENDSSLAFVLRSPIYRWTEKELYDLCADRDRGRPLFSTLAAKRPDVHSELSKIIEMAGLPPYSFMSEIMNMYRPGIISALGRPAIEPLDEFMTLCLSYERTKNGGLAGFLRWFLDGENKIKRDMEQGKGVRILTAHSSKGLESSIVFLIDTTKNPHSTTKAQIFSVLNIDNDVFVCRTGDVGSEEYKTAKEIDLQKRYEEYWRLLYVAMTRARDRLYVFGCEEHRTNESWHSKLYEILKDMPDVKVSDDGTITFSIGPTVNVGITKQQKNAKGVKKHILRFQDNTLKERNIVKNETGTKISDFLVNFNKRFAKKTGLDMHKKLQFLNMNDNSELADKIRQNPVLAKFWDENSKTEVPLAGKIDGKFYSFRIDRMTKNDDEISFLDYKTDSTKKRRDEYIGKLKKYGTLLSQIYPDKKIIGYILWLHSWELEELEHINGRDFQTD
ncbi:MAG: UvrD-helicase domain-containing protein [Rickettsiales bacterium]|jgi:ATP-dependent helicase/nuclease subunit A|nr:UvrD-helicase domain-containing protein [Rickettsiales bacterium]